jgi:hypothetical protein
MLVESLNSAAWQLYGSEHEPDDVVDLESPRGS